MYWLPKLHKRPYKARFIANSSSCTTTELSKLLTSCLTAIKAKVIKYCETVYQRSGKNMFWPIKNFVCGTVPSMLSVLSKTERYRLPGDKFVHLLFFYLVHNITP